MSKIGTRKPELNSLGSVICFIISESFQKLKGVDTMRTNNHLLLAVVCCLGSIDILISRRSVTGER